MGGVVEQSTKGTATSWALFAVTYLSYSALYFARKPVSVVKSTLVKEAGLSLSALGLIDSVVGDATGDTGPTSASSAASGGGLVPLPVLWRF